jgi:hypothetical protein
MLLIFASVVFLASHNLTAKCLVEVHAALLQLTVNGF